jgi:Holliday junction resolvasome RuvABC endonuclease subunit
MSAGYKAITLALHPSSKGFSWVAFSNPFTIEDFGTVGTRAPGKNAKCLRRIEKLISRLQPGILVLEAFEPGQSVRATRITKLGRAIVCYAIAERIDVAIFSFKEVQQQFVHLGATTRQDIAEAIGRLFPLLARHLPNRRRAWESEKWRLSLFCAAALGLTSYQRNAQNLLQALGS